MVVYLAGGMRGNWRDLVRQKVPIAVYLDPCKHQLTEPQHYTIWDLAAVDHCDVVLAYMESDNPSGIGMALEIGYARGKGKVVILADESSNRYMAIVRAASSLWFNTLDGAIEYLARLQRAYGDD